MLQTASVKAGDVYSYIVPVTYRMSDNESCIEEKAQVITAEWEIVVYASNKQVSMHVKL